MVFYKLAFVSGIALLLLSPKDFPRIARRVGVWAGKLVVTLRHGKRAVDAVATEHNLNPLRSQLRQDMSDLAHVRSELRSTPRLYDFMDASDADKKAAVKNDGVADSSTPRVVKNDIVDGSSTPRVRLRMPTTTTTTTTNAAENRPASPEDAAQTTSALMDRFL